MKADSSSNEDSGLKFGKMGIGQVEKRMGTKGLKKSSWQEILLKCGCENITTRQIASFSPPQNVILDIGYSCQKQGAQTPSLTSHSLTFHSLNDRNNRI